MYLSLGSQKCTSKGIGMVEESSENWAARAAALGAAFCRERETSTLGGTTCLTLLV